MMSTTVSTDLLGPEFNTCRGTDTERTDYIRKNIRKCNVTFCLHSIMSTIEPNSQIRAVLYLGSHEQFGRGDREKKKSELPQ